MDKIQIWKILLLAALGFGLVYFILGWIGFGVPHWHAFQRYNGSTQEYYGLWAYCQESAPLYNSICKRWPTAEDQLFNGSRPNFVRVAEGLVTTGMIILTFGLIAGVIAAILPLLAYLAGGLVLLGFLFLVIGVPIFGRDSNNLSNQRGDATHNKRYGFWLMIPTIVLSFISGVLFLLAGFLYQRFGYGNIATRSYSRNLYGGQRMLGPANFLRPGMYGMWPNQLQNQPAVGLPAPSLLSQYIAQRLPRYYAPSVVQPAVISAIPQASIIRSVGQPTYITPAYYRAPSVINLTGRTLAGPVIRSA